MRNINCIFNRDRTYCANPEKRKRFVFFGKRICTDFVNNEAKCSLRKQVHNPIADKIKSMLAERDVGR